MDGTDLPAWRPWSTVEVVINGERRIDSVDHRVTLLDYLREHLDLVGTKKGCDHGQCGACTVLQNGRRVNSCLVLAAMADGTEVVTIEGVGTPDRPHPVQESFVALDALQCGYCTPGQICSTIGMLEEIDAGWPSAVMDDVTEQPRVSDAEIRERMSGNLCRCGTYANIVPAIARARELS